MDPTRGPRTSPLLDPVLHRQPCRGHCFRPTRSPQRSLPHRPVLFSQPLDNRLQKSHRRLQESSPQCQLLPGPLRLPALLMLSWFQGTRFGRSLRSMVSHRRHRQGQRSDHHSDRSRADSEHSRRRDTSVRAPPSYYRQNSTVGLPESTSLNAPLLLPASAERSTSAGTESPPSTSPQLVQGSESSIPPGQVVTPIVESPESPAAGLGDLEAPNVSVSTLGGGAVQADSAPYPL